jgi:hypothetical protein
LEIIWKDGKRHCLTTNAGSAFAAVQQAIDAWSRLWWWDPDVVAIVRRNDEIWNVPVRRVIEAQSGRRR